MLSQNNSPEYLGKVLSQGLQEPKVTSNTLEQTDPRLSGRYHLPIELLHILSPSSTFALALARTVKFCVQHGFLSVQH